jgi:hypothetical protein
MVNRSIEMTNEFETLLRRRLKILFWYTIALVLDCIYLMVRFWPEEMGLASIPEPIITIISLATSFFLIIMAAMLLVIVRKLHDNSKWKSALYDELFYKIRLKSFAVAFIAVVIWQALLWFLSAFAKWPPTGLGVLITLTIAAGFFFGTYLYLSRD